MGRAVGAEINDEAYEAERRGSVTVAFDFDSTAWGFVDAFGASGHCPLVNGEPLSYKNLESWKMLDDLFDGDVHAMLEAMDEARTLECFRKQGLYPGFADAVNTLQAQGRKVVMLTDNSEGVVSRVEQFLAENGLSLPVIRKRGSEKSQWCLDNGVAVLVDDAPATILDAHAKGMPLLAFRYRFNADAIASTGTRYLDYSPSGWKQMLALVEGILAAKHA